MVRGLRRCLLHAMVLLVACVPACRAHEPGNWRLRIIPEAVDLFGPEACDRLLVLAVPERTAAATASGDTRFHDVTREAQFSLNDDGFARVSPTGEVTPLQDGETSLTVDFGTQKKTIPVRIRGVNQPEPVSFQDEVLPILSKAGCNSGGCHGKAEGQNGFRLSVFGFDAAADFDAIVREGRGRRVFPAVPENSLLLAKAVGQMPHGGGLRIVRDSRWHRRLLRWIQEGMPQGAALESDSVSGAQDARQIEASEQREQQPGDESAGSVGSGAFQSLTGNLIQELIVEPAAVTMTAKSSQQLRVTVRDQHGRLTGVTAEADFQSNNDAVAGVDRDGLVRTSDVPGDAAILVRYMGHVAVCRVTRPRDDPPGDRPSEATFVDRFIWDKLEQLRITASPPADDATFLRRAFLDTIGTLPTAAETRAFLADAAADKRRRLVDRLLDRPEYADYWAQRWCDVLQVDKDLLTPQGAVAMSRWVRRQFADNVPYDKFVRAVLTAEGSTLSESPAGFFKVQSDPEKAARAVSQLFLGIRIECAQCHHHPFEKWDQRDYYGWAGFFTSIDRRAAGTATKIVAKPGEDLKNPRTGNVVTTAALGGPPVSFDGRKDRRVVLAEWVTSPENPYFTRVIVNRLFAHFFGRGLVEPLDDQRATNPATNEPLLQALADHLRELKYDQKAFLRTLLNSHAYQLSSEATVSGKLDVQNYSHAAWKPLPAEVLLDAVSQAIGVPERFMGWPAGYRAIEIWDNKLPSNFFQVFGRPMRQSVCACERGTEPSIAQALHLMNSEEAAARLSDRHGTAAILVESDRSEGEIIEELYLMTVSRFPNDEERRIMLESFATADSRRQATEDILWTLLNTKEFVFNH